MVIKIIEQMIFGIEWLINKWIGYLNIKPENILVNKENIKVIDYGLKFFNDYKIINNYMSPELLKILNELKIIRINLILSLLFWIGMIILKSVSL